MGDFPRWIDREDVDSQAMYGAYMRYQFDIEKKYNLVGTAMKPIWWGHLHMILHSVDTEGLAGLPPGGILRPDMRGLQSRACQKRACSRCEHGVGGYQFRWYSPYWAKWYNENRRAHAWKAPEPSETDDYPSLRFWTL